MGRWGESFKVCFLIDKYAMFMWISLTMLDRKNARNLCNWWMQRFRKSATRLVEMYY